jgi:OHCU decarboxylase
MTERVSLDQLNALPSEEVAPLLLRCCGSTEWVRRMAARRPFRSVGELGSFADEVWGSLDRPDWLEAFAAHPRIGEREVPAVGAATSDWAEQEQSATRDAAPGTLTRLAAANRLYEEKFGYQFIVCATGKSAAEMLGLLEQRLPNSPELELVAAADEQRKITRLRLHKLIVMSGGRAWDA